MALEITARRRTPITGASARSGLAFGPILSVTGILLLLLAAAMLVPMLADLAVGHPDWQVFAASAAFTAFFATALVLANRGANFEALTTRQIFLLTTLVWTTVSVFSAVPLALSGLGLSLADAVFEAVSGITTTGSTVMTGLDRAPPGVLLWRAILQWLGGIGIIVTGVAILPVLSVGGMQLFRSESSDRSEKVLPRSAQIASAIGGLYVALTFTCLLTYWYLGMDMFDAAVHAMTTVATGGYSSHDASIGYFANPAIEWAAIVFMAAGGVPFVLYLQALRGRPQALLADVQVRWYLFVLLGSSLLLAAWLVRELGKPYLDALRSAAFTATSIMTGTGYASTDYGQWGTFPIILLFFLKCVGGCTGSTTGGIKIFRFVVLYQVARSQMNRLVQPNGVFRMTYNGRAIAEETAISVMAFFFLFALTFTAVAGALAALGLDYLTAMSASVTALANVGPGLGPIIGPAGHFGDLPEAAKWVLSAAMLLGRLELFTVLVLFTPLFWRG
ncbi:MAG: TrkH family potassium uptake protein [Geminicoccaceae bacterium]|nr:TrkH family potassium uptake protein [Geminicoccaceae bacterium]MDW8341642.1 TrkH family potassium uptake protein [Geminicoccaceae bacterium]